MASILAIGLAMGLGLGLGLSLGLTLTPSATRVGKIITLCFRAAAVKLRHKAGAIKRGYQSWCHQAGPSHWNYCAWAVKRGCRPVELDPS